MKTILLKFSSIARICLLLLITVSGYAQSNTIEFTSNGLKVILRQTQKETLVMSMYFRGGTSNYSAVTAGIESMALSGLIECGTSTYQANDFNDQIDEYGLHMAGIADNDFGVVKLSCITRYTNEAWKLFSSAIASPVFEAQKFELLKEQKINDVKGEQSDPDNRLKWLAQEFAFIGTPYATNPSGTVSSLQSLNKDAVKNYYYNTLLNKNRMFLVVAGNISKEDLEKKITESFANIPAKIYSPASIENARFTEELYKIENRSIATNYIAGIMNAPRINDPYYPAFRLAVTLLNSAMFDFIRLNKQLSYAPYAAISEGKISYVTLYASTTKPEETVKAMRIILSYMKNNKYTEKVLENVRKSHLHSYTKRQEIMSEITDQLGKAEIMGDWKLAENLASRMSSVNAEEMKHVINIYAKNLNWAYLGAPELGNASFNK
jgi:zinc protease